MKLFYKIVIASSFFASGFATATLVLAYVWSNSTYKLNMARAVERLGGRLYFSNECDDNGLPIVNWSSKPVGKGSLTERFCLGAVTFVDLHSENFDDSTVEQILVFDTIVGVRLPPSSNDETLRHLYSLPNLRILELDGTLVTENGFKELQNHNPNVATDRVFEGEAFADKVLDAMKRLNESNSSDGKKISN